jgi:chromosome segregation ATPase
MELRGVVESRIATLERALAAREKEVGLLRQQLRKLDEDYRFNYDLIRERDTYINRLAEELKSAKEQLESGKAYTRSLEGQRKELQDHLREQEAEAAEKLNDVKRAIHEQQLSHQRLINQMQEEHQVALTQAQEEYLSRLRDDDSSRSLALEQAERLLHEKEQLFKRTEESLRREVQDLTRRQDQYRNENVELKGRVETLLMQLQRLRDDFEAIERRYHDEEAEHYTTKQLLAHRVAETDANMVRSIASSEASLRQESTRAAQLELQCLQLQSEITQLHHRLAVVTTQKERDAEKFQMASDEVRLKYNQTIKRQEEELQTQAGAIHALQLDLHQEKHKTADAVKAKERAEAEIAAMQQALAGLETRLRDEHVTSQRLHAELQETLERVHRADGQLREVQSTAQSEQRRLRVQLETLQSEYESAQSRTARELESLRGEAQRLTRELHSSEAARLALEHHAQLNAPQRFIESLREEKERLEKQVMSLEKQNQSIRAQVTQFTSELQNDPAFKEAKQLSQTIQRLEAAAEERDQHVRQLEQRLQQKDEEVKKYQMEILSSSRWYDATRSDNERLRNEVVQAKDAYERALQSQIMAVHQPLPTSGGTAADPDATLATALNEADVWRTRMQQLESMLREVVRERDDARRELSQAQQAIHSLNQEKRSLVDVNSLLKTQLKQAYSDNAAVARVLPPAAHPSPSPEAAPLSVEKVIVEQKDKIAALEREIQAMRDRIVRSRVLATSSTNRVSSGSASAKSIHTATRPPPYAQETMSWRQKEKPHSLSPVPQPNASPSLSPDTSHAIVHRRGAQAVRHYGPQ